MFPDGLLKMLMIDDFGDKLIQLFVSIVIVIVVCLAWWSTNIREQPHYRTVYLLERRLRRRIHQTRLTTHIQSSSIVEGEQTEAVGTSVTQSSETSIDNNEENKPPVPTTSTNTSDSNTGGASSSAEDEELANIVRIMDADTNVVRRRRLAYYDNLSNSSQEGSNNVAESSATSSNTDAVEETINSIVDDHIETLNDTIMEHNYAERDALNLDSIKNNSDKECSSPQPEENTDTNIRIKLKYLNDDLKLVNGKLEEQLGDFKRRHFHPEFASNKLVRLIFNGQVLQSDTETLQSCGLFDNCVVHCLIHQQRNVYNENNSSDGTFSNSRNGNGGLSQGSSNQTRDWDLGNTLLVLVSLILGSAWYFRYEYAHLYTVTATVALVAITGIFTVFLVGIYFPDAEHTNPPPAPPQVEQEAT